MPTVNDILRESGFTDDQIKSLDAKAITAFSGVLTTAQQEREQAELERRSNADFYENKIVPSLTGWDEEKQRIESDRSQLAAKLAYYEKLVPGDAPPFVAPPQGGYRAGAPGGTPGSPTFFDVNKIYERAGDAVKTITDIEWEHRRLTGQSLPISPSELIQQADAQRLDPRSYASKRFDWDAKRQEQERKAQEEHDRQVAAAAVSENDRKWAERVGSNPDVRIPQASRYTDIARAVKAGTRPDPLMMNDSERKKATSAMIRSDLQESA